MADPLSLAAALVGVGSAAISTATALLKFAETVVKAKKQINELATELAHFSVVPNALARVLREQGGILEPALLTDVDIHRQDCKIVLLDIKNDFGVSNSQALSLLGRAKWYFREEKVALQRVRLDRAKASLTLMISILNLAASLKCSALRPPDHQHEVRQQHESATVFVIVTARAYHDCQTQEAIYEEENKDGDSRNSQSNPDSRSPRIEDTRLSEVLSNPQFHTTNSRTSPRLLTGPENCTHSEGNRALNIEVSMSESVPPQIVSRLLLCWTNVEDVSALPDAGTATQLDVEDRSSSNEESHYASDNQEELHTTFANTDPGPATEADPYGFIKRCLWNPNIRGYNGVGALPVKISFAKHPSWHVDYQRANNFESRKMLNFRINYITWDVYFSIEYKFAKSWDDNLSNLGSNIPPKVGVRGIIVTSCYHTLERKRRILFRPSQRQHDVKKHSTRTRNVDTARDTYVAVKNGAYNMFRVPRFRNESDSPDRRLITGESWTSLVTSNEYVPSEYYIDICALVPETPVGRPPAPRLPFDPSQSPSASSQGSSWTKRSVGRPRS